MKAKIILTYLLLLLMIVDHTASAQTWSAPIRPINTNIGTGGNVGSFSQLLVVNGNPAIAYYDDLRGDLVYVRSTDQSGTAWNTPITIDDVGYIGEYIENISLQVVNGHPAISYYSSTNGDLKYVRATDASGTAWATPISPDTAGSVGEYNSLQIVNGYPAISYMDVANGSLKYIRATDASGTNWAAPITLDAGGAYTSLKIVNGNPAIAYSAGANVKYIYATNASGTAWGTPIIIFPFVGRYCSLQVVNGNPAVACYDARSFNGFMLGGLYYNRATNSSGTAWDVGIGIDGGGNENLGAGTSLQIVNGSPAISYYTQRNGTKLKYVRATDASGNAWGTPIIFNLSGSIMHTSLQVVNGNPAISYNSYSNNGGYFGQLKYIRATDASGTLWDTAITFEASVNVGQYTSLQLVSGNPAISYFNYDDANSNNGELKYVRASNTSGTAWASPVIVDLGGGAYSSLQIVSSNPAIAYYEYNSNLKYVRATDSTGTVWGTPVSIIATGRLVAVSLQMVNGNPAIAYSTYPGGSLYFIRADDAFGTTWGTPVLVHNASARENSLQIVNGNPAISYSTVVNGQQQLRYIRADDASGTSWGMPINPGIGDFGLQSSLEIVNGNPAIAYYGYNSNKLKYVRATDSSGSAWGTAVNVDTAEYIGDQTSLKIVDGYPAISYYDQGYEGGLKYVRATDSNGTGWGLPTTLLDYTNGRDISISMISTANGAAIAYYHYNEQSPYFISGTTTSGSVITHYFRSRQSGNWNDTNTWESSPVADFLSGVISPATLTPNINSGMVTVRNGHVVTITSNITLHPVTVNSGSTLNIAAGVQVTIVP